jgi:tetratricopeptide (TPR) repeat protein
MKRALTLLAAAALFAGCATPPPEAAPAPQPEAPPPVQAEPQSEPAPAPVVVTPAGRAQAQKLALRAADLLEEGKLDDAAAQLQQALAMDPANKIANSLQKQMSTDPVVALGAESFNYTVRPGDTLSRIAGRFLGDIYQFHILARYNDIAVPKQVHVGQVIRVPGKAPPPAAVAEPAPKSAPPKRPGEDKTGAEGKKRPTDAPAADKPAAVSPAPAHEAPSEAVSPGEQAYQGGLQAIKAGNKDAAYAAFMQAARLDPKHQDAKARAAQLRQELVQTHHRNATAAFHRQDMDTAIREWDRVLELDPGNETARLNRQRAVDLSERIKQMR